MIRKIFIAFFGTAIVCVAIDCAIRSGGTVGDWLWHIALGAWGVWLLFIFTKAPMSRPTTVCPHCGLTMGDNDA